MGLLSSFKDYCLQYNPEKGKSWTGISLALLFKTECDVLFQKYERNACFNKKTVYSVYIYI